MSQSTIRRFLKQGRIPAQRVGPRLLRIAENDLEAFIERGRY